MSLITTPSAGQVIGCATRVHRALGPGLFESVYQPCLSYEMSRAGLRFQEQVTLPIQYGDLHVTRAFRCDFVVEDELIVELKCVEQVLPVHHHQVLTYLKLSGKTKGLLINFNVALLKQGLKSFVM
jgi:GxxExxY protein